MMRGPFDRLMTEDRPHEIGTVDGQVIYTNGATIEDKEWIELQRPRIVFSGGKEITYRKAYVRKSSIAWIAVHES